MAVSKKIDELENFRNYVRSESNEDSKRPMLYPLFQLLFKDKFKIESDAHGADVYIEGKLIVECKSDASQWLEGFYQALHYHKKFGLTYNTIMVVAHKFVAIWKLNQIPETAFIFHHTADAQKAPNAVGKENAKKTQKALRAEIQQKAFYWLDPKELDGNIFSGARSIIIESFEVKKILNNLDSDRLQINPHTFINTIKRLEPFFESPIEAVHCFYTIVAYWDITSTCALKDEGTAQVVGFKGNKVSDPISIAPRLMNDFKKMVEQQYVFTNEGSGLTVDHYFSRFDEVLANIDPDYVKQHGIFFTNDNLSKFALWFVKEHFSNKLDEDYIVFDPAGGSGNLISSWRGKLKHKIISELQPDLLKTIERRMKVDPYHVETGFTIIPRTSKNEGLNFLDRTAKDYLATLENEVALKNIHLDKPLAFLLNPPYKNTDENVSVREQTESHYDIHPSILELTGEDAGKERYLAFLGQILNICAEQVKEYTKLHPVVMIFTPTSWLIPRPTYIPFRQQWDRHFKYHSGFIVTSNEWFKLDGKWPLAFTIWTYNYKEDSNDNTVKVLDLTTLEHKDLALNWNDEEEELNKTAKDILKGFKNIVLDNSKGDIRELLPKIERNGIWVKQTRLNLYRNKLKEEQGQTIISGFPLNDNRHKTIKDTYGFTDGTFVGFMDDNTPVRIKQEPSNRLSNIPDRVWFRLDNDFKGINKTKTFSGPTDNRSYCAYDLPSAYATFS